MRKFGWGGTLVLMGLALVAAAVPADAGYVLSMAGPATVNPGQDFSVNAVLTGTGPHDSMIFDVGISGSPTLTYRGYLLDPTAYQTGSPDDFSIPKGALDTGRLLANTLAPANAHFEAVTRQGQTFGAGNLVTLDFTVPANAALGGVYVFDPSPDTFASGFDVIPTQDGASLRVSVVPEPATLILLGLGGFAAARRRLFGA